MATLAENLLKVNQIKSDIQQAILSKGGSAGDDFTAYAGAIQSIPTGDINIPDGSRFGYSTWKEIPSEVQAYIMTQHDIRNMFTSCNLLGYNGDVITLHTQPDAIANSLFYNCQWLYSVSLPDLKNPSALQGIFNGCGRLTSIDWDIEECPIWDTAFQSCTSLTAIQLNISDVNWMMQTFYYCTSLQTISLPNLTNVNWMTNVCYNCSSLTSFECPELAYVSSISGAFYNCTSLPSIEFPKLWYVGNMNSTFRGCSSLTSVSMPSLENAWGMWWCFKGCTSLSELRMGAYSIEGDDWGLEDCPLSYDSLLNIKFNISSVGTGHLLYLGANNIAKLTESDIAVFTAKGWTLV